MPSIIALDARDPRLGEPDQQIVSIRSSRVGSQLMWTPEETLSRGATGAEHSELALCAQHGREVGGEAMSQVLWGP
jgi:hypothetical protein